MDAPRIQLATLADLPGLVALLGELFAQEAEFLPDPEAQSRGLRLILENPTLGECLVARRRGDAVGMVMLLYTVSTALGARVALLEDMIVARDLRGSGLGGQLLDAAIAHARGCGCGRITLLTDDTNLDAQRFYSRRGFNRSAMLPYRLMLN